jgi:hypothetical protein
VTRRDAVAFTRQPSLAALVDPGEMVPRMWLTRRVPLPLKAPTLFYVDWVWFSGGLEIRLAGDLERVRARGNTSSACCLSWWHTGRATSWGIASRYTILAVGLATRRASHSRHTARSRYSLRRLLYSSPLVWLIDWSSGLRSEHRLGRNS